MNAFAIILVGLFVVGAVAAVVGLTYAVVRSVRDRRTPAERWADEHGDSGDENETLRNGARLVNGITFGSRR